MKEINSNCKTIAMSIKLFVLLFVPFGLTAQTELYNGVEDEFSGWKGTFDVPNCTCDVVYNPQDSTLDMDFSHTNSPGSIVKKLSASESFAGLPNYMVEFEFTGIQWGIDGDLIVYYSLDSLNWTQIAPSVNDPDHDILYQFYGTNCQGSIGDDIYLKIAFENGVGIWYETQISEINVYDNDNTTASLSETSTQNVTVYSSAKSIYLTSDETINAQVIIYSINGKIVYNEHKMLSETVNEINLNDVPHGMYFITVSGNQVTTKKIMLE